MRLPVGMSTLPTARAATNDIRPEHVGVSRAITASRTEQRCHDPASSAERIEAAAHDLELAGELARQLGCALARLDGILASCDRASARFDEAELAFGGGPEPAQVPRLDAERCSATSARSTRERVVAVALCRQEQRGRDRVVEQGRGGAGLADELVAAAAALAREDASGASSPPGSAGVWPASSRLEVARG